MMTGVLPDPRAPTTRCTPPVPILALDIPDTERAFALVERVPEAEWVKVGLQLFTAAGPSVVGELRGMGRRVFLDLKLHDIPNTVARAVESATALGAELLTVHAVGGREMLRAAREAAGGEGQGGPQLFAVTLLTSLRAGEVAEVWGRPALVVRDEVVRLAHLAADAGMDGVVASVHEITPIRSAVRPGLQLLTPGIRLPGDSAGDQARVATPADAARLGADFLVVGRSVTAADDPAAAWKMVLRQMGGADE